MAEQESSKRQVAHKIRIADILNNRYVKEDGWLPNYISVGALKVSRVNLMGVIVSKDMHDDGSNAQNFIMDDGSGRVPLRFFEPPQPVEVGDIVSVVGRPREFGSDRYVVPEIIRKVDDPKWIEVRKLELAQAKQAAPQDFSQEISASQATPATASGQDDIEDIAVETEDFAAETSPLTKIIRIIKDLDKGNGVDLEEIDEGFQGDAESIIKKLLEQGDVFEVKPGRYKVLE